MRSLHYAQLGSMALLAGCSLGVRLPEGRIACTSDADCPRSWSCRVSSAETSGLCYRSPSDEGGALADDGGAASAADAGASGEDDDAQGPREPADASAEPDASDPEDASEPADGGSPGADGGLGTDGGSEPRVGAPPSVAAVSIPRRTLNAGESVKLACIADDPDGDTLSYAWSSGGGTFETPAARASLYTAGPIGPFALTCTVDDGHGNRAQGFAQARVYPAGLLTLLPFSLESSDASGHNRPGDVYDGIYVADRAGVPSSALELAGTGSVAIADAAAFDLPAWTFVATLRIPPGGGGTIMGKAAGTGFGSYGLFIYPDTDSALPGHIQYFQQATSGSTSYSVVLGSYTAEVRTFFQLAVTRTAAGELRAYVDGTQIALQRNLPTAPSNAGPLVLGSGIFGAYTGILDEVQVYGRALDPTEVATLATMQ